MKKAKASALIPIGVFVAFYLSLGVIFEYVMKIPMGFYSVPVVVAFLVALFVAVIQTKGVSLDKKFEIMGKGAGDKNIITMLIIFMLAGIFVGVVGRSSAESVAYFMLSVTPPRLAVVVIFVVSCFVSTAMGTSVGTITLITPIAVALSQSAGFSLPLCVGTVVGGAMFGDNLSFISDTTIAACNGQGCHMKDKFRTNVAIVVPAALVTLAVIMALSLKADIAESISNEYNLVQIIPYVLVLISGIIGINVFVTLLIGIVSGSIIMLATGSVSFVELISGMARVHRVCLKPPWWQFLLLLFVHLSDITEALMLCLRAYAASSRAERAVSLVSVFWLLLWTLLPLITRLPSLWLTPLQARWRRNTAFQTERLLQFLIPSPVFPRASFLTVHRYLWRSLL